MITKKIKITPFKENIENSLLNKPIPAKFAIPQWYKDQPARWEPEIPKKDDYAHGITVKRCMPLFDSMTSDFIITTKFDIQFGLKDNDIEDPQLIASVDAPDEVLPEIMADIRMHPYQQISNLPVPPEYLHKLAPKFMNHWLIEPPKGYSLLFSHPHNRYDLPFYTLSGTVDADLYKAPVNFPFLLKNTFNGVIPKNTPVAQITIVKRNKWEIVENPFDSELLKVEKRMQSEGAFHYKSFYRESRK